MHKIAYNIFVYILILIMTTIVGCTGTQVPAPTGLTCRQTISIRNDLPEKHIFHLKRLFCEFDMRDGTTQRYLECPKATAEIKPGIEYVYDVTDGWEHSFTPEGYNPKVYYYSLEPAPYNTYEDRFEYANTLITLDIGGCAQHIIYMSEVTRERNQ